MKSYFGVFNSNPCIPLVLPCGGEKCVHLKLDSREIDELVKRGRAVSANFVIPEPLRPPLIVPGQRITAEMIRFLRKLKRRQVHGYHPASGLRLLKPDDPGQPGKGQKHKAPRFYVS